MTPKKYPGLTRGEAISRTRRERGTSEETLEKLRDAGRASLKHGHARVRSATYNSWDSMIQRCTNSRNTSFHRYGGRGIKVCAEWLFFENFLADMGERPDGMTLDRIDNDGHYEPSNCRWATRSEQLLNRGDYRHSPETRARISEAKRRQRDV